MTKKRKRSQSLAFFPKQDSHYTLDLTEKPPLSTFDLLSERLKTNIIKSIEVFGDLEGNYRVPVLKIIKLAAQHAVEEIDLGTTSIGNEGVELLQDILKKTKSLRKLKLSFTELTNEQISALSKGLMSNKTLMELDLSSNHITAPGIEDLNKALENNNTLTALNLSYNAYLGNPGIEALCPAMKKNGALQVLKLRQCNISDAGLEDIIDALKNNPNNSIKELDMGDNELSTAEAESVKSFLNTHPTVKINLTNYESVDYYPPRSGT